MRRPGTRSGTHVPHKARDRWAPNAPERPRWGALVGAQPDGFAVAAVFGGKHELLLAQIEVAVRPAIVGAALELHELLRRLIGALLRRVEARPVFPQLIAAMLGRKDPPRGVECNSFPVAQ